ncbi:MAG TPA: CehA/McbA family metallohydrolase [Candidatus Brocadiia bacterium]|nr:CehA/McbA family metallohydrolase [Candidatus Brocadiia bacterium]
MPKKTRGKSAGLGAKCRPVDISRLLNWPDGDQKDPWWRELQNSLAKYPTGSQRPWGIPFEMSQADGRRVILVTKDRGEIAVPVNGNADFICALHAWEQLPHEVKRELPQEGKVVAEYVLTYSDGLTAKIPVRSRFEVAMAESPGPPFLAMAFHMWEAVDPVRPPQDILWGQAQPGLRNTRGKPFVCAMPNPNPKKKIKSLSIRGLTDSPLLVSAITLYEGVAHPLRHLPRRMYRVNAGDKPVRLDEARVDLGGVARIEHTKGPAGKDWLQSPYKGTVAAREPEDNGEDLVSAFGAKDATLTVRIKGRAKPVSFSLGDAFEKSASAGTGGVISLEVLGRKRQWMKVTVVDSSTGKPTPVRLHMCGPRGEYIAPHGHHEVVNANWFEDYGADVVAGGRQCAYVLGEFTTELPVGDVYCEIYKGFEYEPKRVKATIRPGQKELKLTVDRWRDLRRSGWVTADTHVHFISPQTAWLEAQCEGVNVVNLLASQWGRLFTNAGDLSGKVGVVENDTIVYVGTENRNHMLGHMSMLGTKGLPVYPMCCGGPSESWVGDPDFMTLCEWAVANRRQGGVVIRPHFPYCGFTEDPVPIIAGVVDALEIGALRGEDFPTQEWYRYLNCGYRVAVAGGTDKMGAYAPLGWVRTYALCDPKRPFTYDEWAKAVRAGRTFSSSGPLIGMTVEGKEIGDTIRIPSPGADLEVQAHAECFLPLGKIEIVRNGQVVAAQHSEKGAKSLKVAAKVKCDGSGWIAARCSGHSSHPGGYVAAHTSPVYVKCGSHRCFDGPAAEHMLSLVEGGIEYLQTISTVFDEAAQKRMVKVYREAQMELRKRLKM